MKRTYLFRRPKDDDEEEDFYSQEAVKAKPIDPHLARNLGPTFAAGKDFVRASQKSQNEFYGNQKIVEASISGGGGTEKEFRQMTHDERNNLSASIIKAELKGDKEKVEKLKRRLQEGIIEIKSKNGETGQEKNGEKKPVILMEMDRKSGLAKPAVASNKSNKMSDNSSNNQHIMGVIEEEYSKQSSLDDMLAEEKRTTAEDQISMFNRAAEIFSQNRQDEEGFFDDTLDSRKKRKFDKADSQQRQTMIKEHKFVERTLDSCSKCIESRLFEKHAVVATGKKTYLSVINWDGLSPDHCYITTMEHYSSCLVLDEDVWEEIQFWMKSLVNMWREDDEDQDCVFFENARDIHEQKHMSIECVPLPREIGDLSPIYFKKAIMESEKEWSVNKKLIDLSKNPRQSQGVRGLVPKGFPYFAVYFGLQPGYAHVIEKEKNFPANFAQEIIGGMLDLHYKHWKNPKKQSFNEIKIKREQLRQKFSKYDWTENSTSLLDNEKEEEKEEGKN
uniref:CWF19-like protein 2 n=1 Tax=Meloidogyne incognita TaxID=6306 RepID=A0A914KNZ0_MELIC